MSLLQPNWFSLLPEYVFSISAFFIQDASPFSIYLLEFHLDFNALFKVHGLPEASMDGLNPWGLFWSLEAYRAILTLIVLQSEKPGIPFLNISYLLQLPYSSLQTKSHISVLGALLEFPMWKISWNVCYLIAPNCYIISYPHIFHFTHFIKFVHILVHYIFLWWYLN